MCVYIYNNNYIIINNNEYFWSAPSSTLGGSARSFTEENKRQKKKKKHIGKTHYINMSLYNIISACMCRWVRECAQCNLSWNACHAVQLLARPTTQDNFIPMTNNSNAFTWKETIQITCWCCVCFISHPNNTSMDTCSGCYFSVGRYGPSREGRRSHCRRLLPQAAHSLSINTAKPGHQGESFWLIDCFKSSLKKL